ncbi:MAG: hypothetical protein M1825_001372 [Sarcosagium campestre]|nr:MAG: hypothetical protein M1825_001372 [Sarcosagium campestre]
MLLTSGQISMTISSFIVFFFTSALFLSGYVLQQQTVRNIQTVLAPMKAAQARSSHVHAAVPGKAKTTTAKVAESRRKKKSSQSRPPATQKPAAWNGVAYAQVVSRPEDVCNAVMLFSELHRMSNKAARVLLYPVGWNSDTTMLDQVSSLLDLAADNYNVVLKAVEPIKRSSTDGQQDSYPLSLLFKLSEYSQVLHLAPSGLLLNSGPLDAILSSPPTSPFAALPASRTKAGASSSSSTLVRIRPSTFEFKRVSAYLAAADPKLSEMQLLRQLYDTPDASIIFSGSEESPILETRSLQRVSAYFQAASVFSTTAYVHFSDPSLPGPQYTIGREALLKAKPQDFEAGRVWQGVYARYKQERLDVCGLGTEEWHGSSVSVGGGDEVSERRPRKSRRPAAKGKEEEGKQEEGKAVELKVRA